MAFLHLYPWQIVTRLSGVKLSCRLGSFFDPQRLQEDLSRILGAWRPNSHFGPYHDGGWGGIGLIARNGDPNVLQPSVDHNKKTSVLGLAPYIESVIDSFECEKQCARLLDLAPGSNIYWHQDNPGHLLSGLARLHIPIVTNDKVQFQISHEDCRWRPGEVWYGDFSFPHRVANESGRSRVHLVIDCRPNDALMKLFPQSYLKQENLRSVLRYRCGQLQHYLDPQKTKNRVRRLKSAIANRRRPGPASP